MQADTQRLAFVADLREITFFAATVNLALHDAAEKLAPQLAPRGHRAPRSGRGPLPPLSRPTS